jgi:tRNA-dihydrouridine synthase B
VGRASFGNPWIFSDIKNGFHSEIPLATKISVMIEHTKKFVELYPDQKAFFQMRKHFGWYMKGFDGALEIRKKLMQATSLEDVEKIVASIV